MDDSLRSALTAFIDMLRAQGKANATIVAYGKDIEQFVEELEKANKSSVKEADIQDIVQFQETLKRNRYTTKSVSRKINSIKAFFRFLSEQGLIDQNPAEHVSHPKFDQSPPRVLSKMEYRALRDVARMDLRMYAIIEILLQTGMRISELANLSVDDLNFEKNVIEIQPQDSRPGRRVPMNSAAKAALLDYLRVRPRTKENVLFLTKTCRPFLVRNIRTAVDRYFRLAGIFGAKVNDLRHTFIVEQLKAGTPLVYVSQLVGHKRITTTEKYLKLIDEPVKEPTIQIGEL